MTPDRIPENLSAMPAAQADDSPAGSLKSQKIPENLEAMVGVEPEDKGRDESGPRRSFTVSRRVLAWSFIIALVVLAGAIIVRDIDVFTTISFRTHPVYGWLALAGLALLAMVLAVVVWREVRGFLSLRQNVRLRAAFDKLADNPRDRSAYVIARREFEAFIEHLEKEASPDLTAHIAQLRRRMDLADDVADWIKDVDAFLLKNIDGQAARVIRHEAVITGIGTALSPYAFLDAMISMWRNLRMVRRVAALYRVRPGGAGTLVLARRILVSVALADLSQEAVSMLGPGVLRRASGLGQGTMNALLTIRLGLSAQRLCRPIAFSPGEQPGMLGTMWGAVKDRIAPGKKKETNQAGSGRAAGG